MSSSRGWVLAISTKNSPMATAKGWLYGFFDLPVWTPPSAKGLTEYLEDELGIFEIAKTGMRRITFRHEDPEFAVQLVRWIHEESDEVIREEAQERTRRQIEYIERKLATVRITEHRQSLTLLLSDQEKQMMMTQEKGWDPLLFVHLSLMLPYISQH